MTTYTALSDTTLSQGKPVTQSVSRAWRDNPLAIGEGDGTAPRISVKAINSPYFRATRTTNQSITGTAATKVQLNTEVYDPDSLYDNATNYRFTPNVAGLYLVGLQVSSSDVGSGAGTMFAIVRKNGSNVSQQTDYQSAINQPMNPSVTTIVQMNGTTDYLEGFCSQNVSSGTYNVQGEMYAVCICEA
ncbi:MAG: hypothetical protein IKE42_28285 [Aquamicrobium sp.]|nr:hypothetical protein [Aquamicrobium sp.]